MKKLQSRIPFMTVDAPANGARNVCHQAHTDCIVCSPHHRCGFRFEFDTAPLHPGGNMPEN